MLLMNASALTGVTSGSRHEIPDPLMPTRQTFTCT